MNKLNTIELFAGVGGLLDGFEQTKKYNLLAAVEWLRPQTRTLITRLQTKYNDKNASQKVLNFDIQRTDELIHGWKNDDEFGEGFGLRKLISNKTVDVISGGPPCQAYSLAGRIRDSKGMKDDYRNFLFEAYIRVVHEFRPKLIVFENVEGILSAIPTGEKIINLIQKEFNKEGYEIVDNLKEYALLNLADFGVPQNRKRVIIIGIRRDIQTVDYQSLLHHFYTDLLSKKKSKFKKTVRMAISDLPPIYPLEKQVGKQAYANNNNINGHTSRFHNLRDQEIFYTLAKDIKDGTYKYESTESLINLYYQKTGKKTSVHKYHVLRLDEPSNTIPAHLKKDGLRHIHPDPMQKRTITVREAARLQSFPDDFEFKESQLSNFEMIGNAVPPLFARKLGEVIPKFIEEIQHAEKQIDIPSNY